MKRTVWTTGGCASWYLDAHGRNTTLWPRTTFDVPRAAAGSTSRPTGVEARRPATTDRRCSA